MTRLSNDTQAVVVGGTRGLGEGLARALAAEGVHMNVVARDTSGAAKLPDDATLHRADARDPAEAAEILRKVRPSLVFLVAGTPPPMGPIDEISWPDFSLPWEVDVRIALSWVQAALRQPLDPGSVVVMVSSGAAISGSPLSGGYAGAKRMQWLMSDYANACSGERGLGIRFITIAPLQMAPGTGTGMAGAGAYAAKGGITTEAFFARFGDPLTPERFGGLVIEAISDPKWAEARALGLRSEGLSDLEPAVT